MASGEGELPDARVGVGKPERLVAGFDVSRVEIEGAVNGDAPGKRQNSDGGFSEGGVSASSWLSSTWNSPAGYIGNGSEGPSTAQHRQASESL